MNIIHLIGVKKKHSYPLISSDLNGKFVKISDTEYHITPSFNKRIDTLTIVENGVEIRQEYYKVNNPPIPFVQLGDIHYEFRTVSIDQLLKNPTLKIVQEGIFIATDSIISFQLKIYVVEEVLLFSSEETLGNQFTLAQLKRIAEMLPGHIIEIAAIRAQRKTGIVGFIGTIRFEIE